MALPQKRLRKITVNQNDYVYSISKPNNRSDWRENDNELNEIFDKYSIFYGSAILKDVTINITVMLSSQTGSRLSIILHTILVDRSKGIECVTQITPKLVSSLIRKCLIDGWHPESKENFTLQLVEKNENIKFEAFVLPDNCIELTDKDNLNTDEYDNLTKFVEVKCSNG